MNQHVSQAVKEALGENALPKHVQDQVAKRAGELRPKTATGEDQDVEGHLAALREALGLGVFNPNVEAQVRNRARVLAKSGADTPAPGSGANKTPQMEAPSAASASPVANPQAGEDEAGKTKNPHWAAQPNAGQNPPGTNTKVPGTTATRSLKEGVEGDINAQQKAQFEKDPRAATHGGTNPGVGVTNSEVAAATNTANQVGGPGAGTVGNSGR